MAFLLAGTLNLYEHQSTFCPNLPLRFLLYIAAEYESLVAKAKANIYGQTLIPLPSPQCVVFYNGDDAMPDEQCLRLTDAFPAMSESEGHVILHGHVDYIVQGDNLQCPGIQVVRLVQLIVRLQQGRPVPRNK